MKKQLRKIIIGVAVLMVLTGVLLFLAFGYNVEADAIATTIHHIIPEQSRDDLYSISFDNEHGNFTITFSEQRYWMDIAVELPLHGAEVSSLRNFWGNLNATIIEENVNDIAVYGLDEPSASFTLRFIDGNTYSFILGTTIHMGTYAQRVGVDRVYLFNPAQSATFFREPRTFVSPMVIGRITDIIYDRVKFSGTHRPEPVILEPNPDRERTGVDYVVVSPRSRIAGRAAAILVSLSEIRALEVVEIFPSDESLELFGLSVDPFSVVTIEYAGETLTFTASAPTRTGHFYMMTCQLPIIYFMSTSPFDNEFPLLWYDALYQDFLSTFILHLSLDTIEKIEIMTEEQQKTFFISGRDEPVLLNGQFIPFEIFYYLFRLLITAPNEGFFDETLHPDNTPILTVTYHFIDPNRESHVLTFYEIGPRRVVGAIDTIPEFHIRMSFIEEIVSTLSELQ